MTDFAEEMGTFASGLWRSLEMERLFLAVEMLPLNAVKQESQNNPDNQHDIGFLSEMNTGKPGDGNQLEEQENHGEANAHVAINLRKAVLSPSCRVVTSVEAQVKK